MKTPALDEQDYIISQYGASPTIKKLLYAFAGYINPDADIQTFYDNIMNIETAQGVGLDYWGRIVGVERNIYIDSTTSEDPLFGFAGGDSVPFNQGIFFDPNNVQTGKRILVTLIDDSYRQLILYKALANISTADLATLNQLAVKLFNDTDILAANVVTQGTLPNGDFYNTSPMTIRFVWRRNSVSNLDKALFETGIVLSLAAGVQYDLKVISKDPLFGFAGSGLNPFNQGAFVNIITVQTEPNTQEG